MGKKLTGTIISAKMEKTVVVGVKTTKQHPVYKKYIQQTTKCYAQDELGAKRGDKVVIEETKPLSKMKRWKVVKTVNG